jgi:hypothetical protein
VPNNRFHKGAQKPGGLGNNDFIIKHASHTVRIAFVPCEAERYESMSQNIIAKKGVKGMNLQKIGGICSIATTALLIKDGIITTYIYPRLGLIGAPPYDAAKMIDAINISATSFFLNYLTGILNSITYVLIVLGLKERMQDKARNLFQVTIIALTTTCALWFASSSIGIFDLPSIAHVKDISAFRSAYALRNCLSLAGDSAAGWMFLLTGIAAVRTKMLPKILGYLILVVDFGSALVFAIKQVGILVMLLLMVYIIMTIVLFWLGIHLIRNPDPIIE